MKEILLSISVSFFVYFIVYGIAKEAVKNSNLQLGSTDMKVLEPIPESVRYNNPPFKICEPIVPGSDKTEWFINCIKRLEDEILQKNISDR